MSATHTPGPWQAMNRTVGITISSNVGEVVGPHAVSWDDAEFIVRACNVHAELLAALRAVAAWVDMGGLRGPHANPDAYPDDMVRAVLAKATGGA